MGISAFTISYLSKMCVSGGELRDGYRIAPGSHRRMKDMATGHFGERKRIHRWMMWSSATLRRRFRRMDA